MHRLIAQKGLDVGNLAEVVHRIQIMPGGKLTDLLLHSSSERNLDGLIKARIRQSEDLFAKKFGVEAADTLALSNRCPLSSQSQRLYEVRPTHKI